MSSGARRLGYDEDPEREQRFQRIEQEVGLRQLSNMSGSASARTRSRIIPPQVAGPVLSNNIVGGLSIKWTPSKVPDVRYEVQVSPVPSFDANLTRTYRSDNSYFTMPEGNPDLDNFVRIRAVNSTGKGGWSSTLNGKTGVATQANIVPGSTSLIKRVTDTNAQTVTNANSREFAQLSLATIGRPVLVFVTTEIGSYTYDNIDTIMVEILLNDVAVETFQSNTNNPSAGTAAGLTGIAIPTEPGAGEHTYKVKYSITGGGTTSLPVTKVKMALWEARR